MIRMGNPAQADQAPRGARAPEARVWVLDDPRADSAVQAIGIAERLDLPFRRIPLTWNHMADVVSLTQRGSPAGLATLPVAPWGASPESGPAMVISAGSRSVPVALWLKQRFGCHLVHCMRPGLVPLMRESAFDLLVVPEHDAHAPAPNVMQVVGVPHRVSPLLLEQAAASWRERLAHLPEPRVALMVGGPPRGTDLQPMLAHRLGQQIARLVARLGGSIMASTSRSTGAEATEALSAGLSPVLHVLYRWGEPGHNPYHGFLGTADAVVVTADSASMLSEACASAAPVFYALPELAGLRQRRLLASLEAAGQVRRLGDSLQPWARTPLDEAGRVAAEIRRRFRLD
jgi:uncharacterized protein